MLKLDLKDRKLLYELDINSRQSAHQLARKIGLSKDAIIYRMKKLQDMGIIKQFHTVIDVGKLNFISFRLYLKLQNTTPEKVLEIISYLKAQPAVTWLVSIDGKYDLGMWILVRTITEMNAFWKGLLQKYRDHIETRQLTLFTKVSYFPRAYFLERKVNDLEYVFISEPHSTDIDKTDLAVLQLLASQARLPVIEIAQKLKLTAKTIASRIRLLEKKNVIVGYRTVFNLEKLGYLYYKVHFNLQQVTPQKERQFKQYIKQHPNIVYDNEVLGGDDIEIEVQVPSPQEFRKFCEEIKREFVEIIKGYNYMLFYQEHKFVFFPTGQNKSLIFPLDLT